MSNQLVQHGIAGHFTCSISKALLDGEENAVFSPFSIITALTMCYAGASNANLGQMNTVLFGKNNHNQKTQLEQISAMLQKYSASCTGSTKSTVANGLWARGIIEKTYQEAVKSLFKAEIRPLESAAAINQWVEDHTNKLIKDLVPTSAITVDTIAVLVNAIYFKGMWEIQFKKKETVPNFPFTLMNGSSHKVNMMTMYNIRHEQVFYGKHNWSGSPFSSLTLPYQGSTFSMIFLRPNKAGAQEMGTLTKAVFSESNIVTKLTGEQANPKLATIRIPTFKLEQSAKLNDILQALGMKAAFESPDSFTGITKGIVITDVLHKAFIEVNEEGTEAAAATAVVMGKKSKRIAKPPPPLEFILDVPFISLLVHTSSSSIIFVSKVCKP